MEKFSLEKYLETPNRKVVTRDGRPVRIVCWDKLDDKPAAKEQKIVALVKESCKEYVFVYNNNGDGCISALDLFFADEEEQLTEFEKHVQAVMMNCGLVGCTKSYKDIDVVKATSKHLLDLARKELQPEFDMEMDEMLAETDKVVYQKGKQDALKSLPKWEKNELPNSESYIGFVGSSFCYQGYNINYDELFEKLPKEEYL